MGAFVTYVLKAGIFLLFFYLFNRLFLARETFIIPISLMLPFCIPEFFNPFTWFGGQPAQNQVAVIPESVTFGVLDLPEHSVTAVRMVQWFTFLYFTGVFVTFIFYVVSYARLISILQKHCCPLKVVDVVKS